MSYPECSNGCAGLWSLAISFAPVFAAFALKPEYGGFGPAAIGFYRVFFALPFLWLVLLATPVKSNKTARTRRPTGLLALAGFFFAVDLVSWHWSIKYTTVANATLLANFAPLWVTCGPAVYSANASPFAFSLRLAWRLSAQQC
ncbi:MAG: hypothetical protein CM1200mP29_07240 [Verrucomicrobiota bacterium]|nr:MAG: hypothetical protein CM1200mP29_07240 [Verrucomicrobiota bacterium]